MDKFLDGVESGSRGSDLTKNFADPLAYAALCQFLGLPATGRALIDAWLHTFEDPAIPPAGKQHAGKEMMAYLKNIVRSASAPAGSLLSHLQSTAKESTDTSLTEHELTCIFVTLMIAGYETLRNMISLSLLTLIVQPDLAEELREEPALMPAAVDEFARYYSVLHRPLPRRVMRDVVISGKNVRAGEYIAVSLPAANWDEKYFKNPEKINFRRSMEAPHLSFGHGIHHCLGRALASSVLKSVIYRTQQRMPRLRLESGQKSIKFLHHRLFYGVDMLSVEWD
ncbi:cytochrome P450 [Streptomyces sp. NPDC058664]|uniref:cytochrome P450 n=1 Tax=unclassified Streptomyces TaxID=2593676 RepID=UPI003653BB94